MNKILHTAAALLLAAAAAAADSPRFYPNKLVYQLSLDETFEVVPRPGWSMYPGRKLTLRFGSVLIRGPQDKFSLSLNFICDTADLAKFDTPQKMERQFQAIVAPFYQESQEKFNRIPLRELIRPFRPRGRFGYALRITNRRYAAARPPAEEWKFLTCGIFRIGDDSVLQFTLLSNTIDDREYVELLNYVAALAIPESGAPGWQAGNAAAALRLAETEFNRRYPEAGLLRQQPYSVVRQGERWLVSGERWRQSPGGVATAEIDGPDGRVLRVVHGK